MKKYILVVEDDRWLADMYQDVLQAEFEIVICHDSQAAIGKIDTKVPDLILLDIMLPGGNGLAFLQELRTYTDVMNVPVVVCSSAHLSSEQRDAITHFAPIAILNKEDLTPKRLIEVIEEQVHAHPNQ